MSAIPETMKALVIQEDKTAKVQDIPVPEIKDDEVLVKVVAVAQNPTDWKHVKYMTHPGTISGCDWSGYVVKTGKNVSTPAIGAHVAGFVHGSTYTDSGAFAEYLKTSADLTWTVPEGTVTHEQAATLGCALWTAVQGLFHPARLGLVEPPSKTDKLQWALVYGGSSSVGMYTVQLLHAAGYKVVTTASPRNHELMKSYGADAVFDYKDPGAVRKIKELTNDSIAIGLDAISEVPTEVFSVQAFGKEGGKLIVIVKPYQEAAELRPDVELQLTMIYTALGRAFTFDGTPYPAAPEDRAHMVHFLKRVPELVKSGAVVPNPTKLIEGGLNGINEGFQLMMEGKVSGEQLVYRLSN